LSAEDVDAYLRGIEEPKRSTLEALRRTILEIVPNAEQAISYKVPAFRVEGRIVAGFAAFKDHLSYLPFSGSVLPALASKGPEYLAWLGEQPEADYAILMGATTYRVMSRFAAAGEPGTEALAGMPKVVFSTTLSEPLAWANTRLVAGDAVEWVREMKATDSKSMRTIGSLSLCCRSLLNAGLVDRFRVVVFPVITGRSGRERIYDGYPDVALEMIASRTFDGRIQLLEYVPTILTGPSGNNTANP
jgi:dihydrofolate reductase